MTPTGEADVGVYEHHCTRTYRTEYLQAIRERDDARNERDKLRWALRSMLGDPGKVSEMPTTSALRRLAGLD